MGRLRRQEQPATNQCLLSDNCLHCYRSLKRNIVRGSTAGGEEGYGRLVLFVGDKATVSDSRNGVPFTGKSDKLLREIISLYKMDDWAYLTNVIKCYGADNESLYIKKCIPHLINEIRTLKPIIIVPVGAFALKALTDLNHVNMSKEVNRPRVYANSIMIPIYGTAYIAKTKLYEEYDKSFKIISEILYKIDKDYIHYNLIK